MTLVPTSRSPLSAEEIANLFSPFLGHDKIALAVSGGADSVALMVLAVRWATNNPDTPGIVVMTVDHGLRPDSTREAETVALWAKKLGAAHHILRWEDEKPRTNIQAAARDVRYALLTGACHRVGADILVSAHHLEDQAETFLLRLARGSGVDGLGAMKRVTMVNGISLVRPCLDVPRARLRASLKDLGHPWIEDPSNEDEKYSRVKIRKLQPLLDQVDLSPKRIAATARRMRAAQYVLDQAADRLADGAVTLEPAGYCVIDRDQLVGAARDTAMRLLSRCLLTVGGQIERPRFSRTEALLRALKEDKVCRRTLAGCAVVRRKNRIWIWREAGRSGLPEMELCEGNPRVWDRRFLVRFTDSGGMTSGKQVVVRALGKDGWQRVRSARDNIPAALGRTFVSFWMENRLVGVPHLTKWADTLDCKADFKDRINLNKTTACLSRQ